MRSVPGPEKQIEKKRYWHRTYLAVLVAFLTLYALILPAITLEQHGCELEEHIHGPECFAQVLSTREALRECRPHLHEDFCFDAEGELICGYADFYVHEHDASCFDAEGELLCCLPELKAHIHTEECFAAAPAPEPAAESHQHEASCYSRSLICQEEEGVPHLHTEDCFREESRLICPLEEEEGHLHEALCFDEAGLLICELEEGHIHGDACFESFRELICGLEEGEAHWHGDACYSQEESPSCGFPEEAAPILTEPSEEADADGELLCGEEEIILHQHGDDCWDAEGKLICPQPEILEHQHEADCFYRVEEALNAGVLTCTLPESEEHQHGQLCFGVWELFCQQPEHQHTKECEAPGALSEEEEAEIEDVSLLIAELPTAEEVEETLRSHGEAEDWAACQNYWTELRSQVEEASAAYEALNKNQKSYIENVAELMELESLCEAGSRAPGLPEDFLLEDSPGIAETPGLMFSPAPEADSASIALSIPVEVICRNSSLANRFSIQVQELTKDQDGSWLPGESLDSLSLSSEAGETAAAELLLSYPAESSGSFYYRLRQEPLSSYVLYDESEFILEILLAAADQEQPASAAVQNIWKDGELLSADDPAGIVFENEKFSSLLVTNSLSGMSGISEPFAFEALLTDADGNPLSPLRIPGSAAYQVEGNCIRFTLCDGESLELRYLPAGAFLTVTEAENEAFIVYHRLDEGGELICSNSAAITGLAEDKITSLHFINNNGYTLPATGGTGNLIYSLGGSLILLLSGSILLIRNMTPRRKEDRELP